MTKSKILVLIGSGLAVAASPAITGGAYAQTPAPINWRVADTWSANGITVAAQVGSTRKIRLISDVGTSRVISPELEPESLRQWLAGAHRQIDAAAAKEIVLPDAVLIAPYPSARLFEAYSLTLQDTSGVWVATRGGPGLIDAFLRLLDNSVAALAVLSDAELAHAGPLTRTDPQRVFAPELEFPHWDCNAPLASVLFNDEVANGRVILNVKIDSAGHTDVKKTKVVESSRQDLTTAAYKNLKDSKFRPAMVDGHAVEGVLTIPFDFKLDSTKIRLVRVSSDVVHGGRQLHGTCLSH